MDEDIEEVPIDKTPERILCAAIYYHDLETPMYTCKNTGTGVVLCGHRHAHIIHQLKALTGKNTTTNSVGNYTQGFLTNKNRFVDRKEALAIAKEQNQIIHRIPLDSGIGLTSEDIY